MSEGFEELLGLTIKSNCNNELERVAMASRRREASCLCAATTIIRTLMKPTQIGV